MPLGCAYALARTERAAAAWLGALASVALIAWLLGGVVYAERYERLADVVMLSIAPLVALPGCVRLSRVAERLRLAPR